MFGGHTEEDTEKTRVPGRVHLARAHAQQPVIRSRLIPDEASRFSDHFVGLFYDLNFKLAWLNNDE